jgi:chromosome partition protein MukE
MDSETSYQNLNDVLDDPLFPEIDCQLRKGVHIGHEDITAYSFLQDASQFLRSFYKRYHCELVHDNKEEADFFFLSSYGDLLGNRKLSAAEMVVGMTLAYMLMDPEYISKKIPLDRLIFTMKGLMGNDEYLLRMAPRFRGRDSEGDEQKAEKEVSRCLRRLEALGFLSWPRSLGDIMPKSPIFRFIAPARGLGNLDENIKILVNRGLVEIDQLEDEDLEVQEEGADE